MFRSCAVFAAFKQLGHVVGGRDLAAPACGCERCVTVASGDVQHLLITEQVAGFGQLFADDL
ncbi:hypothetical protein D3C87_2169220 [compost metagenome]